MDYLESLNEPQRAAVINTEGPTMIIAGAGSGKTRVLTYRIAYLMEARQVEPFNILSLTFTNKAAREMRQRIEEVVGSAAKSLWMGTFHSVFSRILRAEAHHIGYTSDFTIYDTDDSKALIRQIIKQMALDDKIYKPNMVLNRISGAKNRLISWRDYINNPILVEEDKAAQRSAMGKIFQTYVQRCVESCAMDFDDLLFNTNVLFRDHPDVLHKYQHRFKYVLVDEFQDTNISQYLITKKLAAVNENICVVGDDAQSIYAFRGADIQNILNFEKDYQELKTFKLEQNYRSTQFIVNAANSVIRHNKGQLPKKVWTANDSGSPIELIKATSDNEEAKLVATTIFEARMNGQLNNSDFAILYRTNSQSRSMEEALRRANIKYRIVGGLSFYQRKEIKDLLAYLRFIVNPADEQAFRRIINLPKRGIGPGSVEKVMLKVNENRIPLNEVLNNIHQLLPGRAANAIEGFNTLIKNFRFTNQSSDAFEVASKVAKNSGLLKDLYADKTPEGLSRYENVQELLNAIKEFVDNPENEDKSLTAFLQEVALITDADKQDTDEDTVTLMTIHSSKGLEFKYVFIVGLEEELFPSQMMLNSREDLEEERRLFYVAITRAQEKLFLSYAMSRYRFGRLKNCDPSRFLDDIDPSYLKISNQKVAGMRSNERGMERNVQGTSYARSLVSGIKRDQSQLITQKNRRPHTPTKDFQPSDVTLLKEGMRVEHPKFGFGIIKRMDLNGANKKASVDFEGAGEKTLLLSFAKLKIHQD
ncbi:ATP-dependent helicase [Xanthovirga aplysinae]|uniref:ATP-dependent helicase n=1 Tax=Xanthovirga aplysinae TaxID=2529853 RepID=UPI0012BD173D|nr:UvrD-helicase domain-containing protein [Xanthovirga aplysinae]MTI33607.1 ATP-dependent DNA helicase [Xanthovirga aplysinae]